MLLRLKATFFQRPFERKKEKIQEASTSGKE